MSMNKTEQVKTTVEIRAQILVSIEDAARLLGIGRTLMLEIRDDGKIPEKRLKTKPMFRVKDLERFADDPEHFIGEHREIRRTKPFKKRVTP
jgi:hypothetical protein